MSIRPKAVEIGEQELSAICHAVGHMGTLKDSEALHGQPFLVCVVIDPETGRNKIGRVLFKEKFEDTRLPARPAAATEGEVPATAQEGAALVRLLVATIAATTLSGCVLMPFVRSTC